MNGVSGAFFMEKKYSEAPVFFFLKPSGLERGGNNIHVNFKKGLGV